MDQEKLGDKIQFIPMSKEELEEMISKSALIGAQVASEMIDKAHKKEQKEQKDRKLHNTELLLRNYRMLKESCGNAVFEKINSQESTEDVIEDIMAMHDDRVIVHSIKKSAERTAIIISHIDKMLDIYRVYCGKYTEREKRQYKVIKAMYISKTKSNVAEISKKFGVSKVTIYDDLKIATERLSALFFGVCGLHLY